MSLRRFALCLALALAAPGVALAEDIRIVGDSIGEGLHLVANYPSPANRFNVAIYTPFILEQLEQMPRGATVVMSLGTNDAVGGAAAMDVQKRVEAIVAAAAARELKLYWVGPPCVRKPWETYSKKLDEILQAQLASTSVTYVSTQDPSFCEASLHAGDGVHFTMAGYALLWQKAATAAGIPVVVAAAGEHKSVANVGKKTPGKKKRKKKPAAAASAAPSTPAPN
jgi:hypothetical protein